VLEQIHTNPTRDKIIYLLKKKGPLSVEELAQELRITSMGIRQHLLSLEKKGYIDYVPRKQGIGRPAFLYRLTSKAQNLFPTMYDEFLLDVFQDIEASNGRQKIDDLFARHKVRFLNYFQDAQLDGKPLRERLMTIADVLSRKGYLAELVESNNHFSLRIFNCPLLRLSSVYKDACRYHLEVFRELIGKEVNRESCIVEGDTSCTYVIPKKSSP